MSEKRDTESHVSVDLYSTSSTYWTKNWASQVALVVKNTPANAGDVRVWSLGWEDPLEGEMAAHFSILAWRIPWTEELGGLESIGSQRVGHNWVSTAQMTNKSVWNENLDNGSTRRTQWIFFSWIKQGRMEGLSSVILIRKILLRASVNVKWRFEKNPWPIVGRQRMTSGKQSSFLPHEWDLQSVMERHWASSWEQGPYAWNSSFFFLSLCIPSCYQKLGLFIWVTIVLHLFSPLLGGTQTLICASSHIKERVQSGLLTRPHSLEPSEKSFPPRCLKSGFVHTRRSTGSAHEAEFWHIWRFRSLWHQELFWTSSSTAWIPSPSHQLCWALKKNYCGKTALENKISSGVSSHIKIVFSVWFQ